jgi:hypothetical protein
VPDEELLLDGADAGVDGEEAGVDEVEDVVVAVVPVSFFEGAPDSADSPEGGFILLE